MKTLVEEIRDRVPVLESPAVNISGGIDSTVVLHHLREKFDGTIRTYTLGFPDIENEFEHARKVAEFYGTVHTEVKIENMLSVYPELLRHFEKPRYNLWPYFLAQKERDDGCKYCYIGEGGDEHFGGYWYKPEKSYVEHWSSFFEYCISTYQTVYRLTEVGLVIPMHPNNLSTLITLPHYDYSQNKAGLKKAYKNILPKFVLERKKQPGRFSYWVIWKRELKQHFPGCSPQTEKDIVDILNLYVTKTWLDMHLTENACVTEKYAQPFLYAKT